MKKRLLIVGLMSFFVVNIQASSLREIIAQNPGTCAVAGYAVGSLGYQYLSGCAVTPFVKYGEDTSKRELNLVGLQLMGASIYVYVETRRTKHDVQISVGKLRNAARPKLTKKNNHRIFATEELCKAIRAKAKEKSTAIKFAIEKNYTNKTDKALETEKCSAYFFLGPDIDDSPIKKCSKDQPYNIARFATTKECRFEQGGNWFAHTSKDFLEYHDGDTEEFGYGGVLDLKTIAIGLVSSAIGYGLSSVVQK